MAAVSQEQVMEQLKLLLPAIGGLLTMAGILTPTESAKLIANVMTAAGPMMIIGGMVWGILDKRQKSLVQKVDVLAKDPDSAVKAVITTDTPEGRALANSIEGTTTVTAGTVGASSMAKAA